MMKIHTIESSSSTSPPFTISQEDMSQIHESFQSTSSHENDDIAFFLQAILDALIQPTPDKVMPELSHVPLETDAKDAGTD